MLDGVVVTLTQLESELADNTELYEMSKEDNDVAGLIGAFQTAVLVVALNVVRTIDGPSEDSPASIPKISRVETPFQRGRIIGWTGQIVPSTERASPQRSR